MSACLYPKRAFIPNKGTGLKYTPVMPEAKSLSNYKVFYIPCKQCDTCIKNYKMQWAVRAAMEIHTLEEKDIPSIFVTLTYSDELSDGERSLNRDHFKLFSERLRKYAKRKLKLQHAIKYQQCGEYGEQTQRRHHHVLIFGMDFQDKEYFSEDDNGIMYKSETLNDLWSHGYCIIQEANMGTAQYLAGYVAKKIYGKIDAQASGQFKEYERIGGGSKPRSKYLVYDEDRNILELEQEYLTASHFLGMDFYRKYKRDLFPKGTIHLRTSTGEHASFPVPDYFYKKLEKDDPELYEESIQLRRENGIKAFFNAPDEQSPDRQLTKAKLKRLLANRKGSRLNDGKPLYSVDVSDIEANLIINKQLTIATRTAEKRILDELKTLDPATHQQWQIMLEELKPYESEITKDLTMDSNAENQFISDLFDITKIDDFTEEIIDKETGEILTVKKLAESQ